MFNPNSSKKKPSFECRFNIPFGFFFLEGFCLEWVVRHGDQTLGFSFNFFVQTNQDSLREGMNCTVTSSERPCSTGL